MNRAENIVQRLLEMDVHSAKDTIEKLTPTKTIKLGGNDMLNAAGMVNIAIREYNHGQLNPQGAQGRSLTRGQKWARQLLHVWELSPEIVDQILTDPRTTVEGHGNNAIITIHLYAQPARNSQSRQRPPADQ